ncbi:Gfo/Idh/MocA family protein [Geomicrobium sp. JCM 19055]|uniref:Gfo/Idh/MocA family protein n=1 Tax=Geomicrobium sp. JCM 19055 TaxID=1460649 RepID=UPI00045ED1C4|nr:Gfo/Idh/MocA family oxidoreductase [Geomicrobium sp. JCM 19055]GAK00704.1 oxidoreductase [Geomicrobium sp. JCM 19055]
MKVGIIGGGFGLNVQAPIIALHPEMEVTEICTMNRHRLPDHLLDEERAPVHYKCWTLMLEKEELDVVFVSSLPRYHFVMVKEALIRGIHVVCEKPFTMNHRESQELVELAALYDAKVVIDFEWRYHPARQKMKELMLQGLIGEAIHFEYHISSPQYQSLHSNKRGWMGEKQQFGGMLGALGTHMIDCLRWLVDDEVVNVNGLLHTHVPEGAGEMRDADDGFFIHGKMKKNCTFSIQLLSGVNHGFGSSIKVFGRQGTIALENDKLLLIGQAQAPLEELDIRSEGKLPALQSKEAVAYYPAFYPFVEKVYD